MNTQLFTVEVKAAQGEPGNTGPFTGPKSKRWVDAGFSITDQDRPRMEVSGSVNLCEHTSAIPSRQDVKVPWMEAPGTGQDDKTGVPTSIIVNPGDLVSFFSIDKVFRISDCNNPPTGVYVHDVEQCKNGYDRAGEAVPSYLNRDITAAVAFNDVPDSPEDNIVMDVGFMAPRWVRGGKALIIPEYYKDGDAYTPFPPMTDEEKAAVTWYQKNNGVTNLQAMKAFRCGSGITKDGIKYSLDPSRVTAYEVNKFCGNIAIFTGKVNCADWEKGNRPNEGSIAYEAGSLFYDTCSETVALPPEVGGGTMDMPQPRNMFFARLASMVKAVDATATSKTLQMIPSPMGWNAAPNNTRYQSNDQSGQGLWSISLGHRYTVNSYGRLWMIIYHNAYGWTNQAHPDSGGYHVRITRECPATNNLYMYISKNKDSNGNYTMPEIDPGDASTIMVPLPSSIEEDGADLYLNGFHTPASGRVFFAVKDNGDGYANNTGSYKISVNMPSSTTRQTLGTIVRWVEEPIMDAMFGQLIDGKRVGGYVNLFYDRIIDSEFFQRMVNVVAAMAIAFFGFFALGGLAQVNLRDGVMLVLKLGIIYQLLQPNSWEFFNQYVFSIVVDGMMELVSIVTTPADMQPSPDYIFDVLDQMVGRFFNVNIWVIILSHFLSGPIGYLYGMAYLTVAVTLLVTIFSALLSYFAAKLLAGIMIAMFPIFALPMPFKWGGKITHSWIKYMSQCLFTPMVTFAMISVVGSANVVLLDSIFSIGICSRCAIYVDIGSNVIKFCLINSPLVEGVNNATTIESRLAFSAAGAPDYFLGLSIAPAILFTCLTLNAFLKSSVSIAQKMVQSMTGVFAPGAADIARGIAQDVKWVFGQDDNSRRERMMAKVRAAEARGSKGVNVKGEDGKKPRDKGASGGNDNDGGAGNKGVGGGSGNTGGNGDTLSGGGARSGAMDFSGPAESNSDTLSMPRQLGDGGPLLAPSLNEPKPDYDQALSDGSSADDIAKLPRYSADSSDPGTYTGNSTDDIAKLPRYSADMSDPGKYSGVTSDDFAALPRYSPDSSDPGTYTGGSTDDIAKLPRYSADASDPGKYSGSQDDSSVDMNDGRSLPRYRPDLSEEGSYTGSNIIDDSQLPVKDYPDPNVDPTQYDPRLPEPDYPYYDPRQVKHAPDYDDQPDRTSNNASINKNNGGEDEDK